MSPAPPVVSPVELELELLLELLLVLSSPPVSELVSPPELLLVLVAAWGNRQKPCSSQVASASQQLESSAHQSPAVPTATQLASHVKSSAAGVSPMVRRAEQLSALSEHGEQEIDSPSASQHGSAGSVPVVPGMVVPGEPVLVPAVVSGGPGGAPSVSLAPPSSPQPATINTANIKAKRRTLTSPIHRRRRRSGR